LCFVFSFLLVYFFFFQAEDGIRDRNVTGVQTCALPILHLCGLNSRSSGHLVTGMLQALQLHCSVSAGPVLMCGDAFRKWHHQFRSEERRVGKEGRAWWGSVG